MSVVRHPIRHDPVDERACANCRAWRQQTDRPYWGECTKLRTGVFAESGLQRNIRTHAEDICKLHQNR